MLPFHIIASTAFYLLEEEYVDLSLFYGFCDGSVGAAVGKYK
jgi:hypothetical protein